MSSPLRTRDSSDRFWRRKSTAMPTVGARRRGIPAACRHASSTLNLTHHLLQPAKQRFSHYVGGSQVFMELCAGDSRTFSSSREKPRPSLVFRLYLRVGQRTTGRRRSTGRGATAAALARRASRRRTFLPGYFSSHQPPFRASSLLPLHVNYLVEVAADSPLPVLAEV